MTLTRGQAIALTNDDSFSSINVLQFIGIVENLFIIALDSNDFRKWSSI